MVSLERRNRSWGFFEVAYMPRGIIYNVFMLFTITAEEMLRDYSSPALLQHYVDRLVISYNLPVIAELSELVE